MSSLLIYIICYTMLILLRITMKMFGKLRLPEEEKLGNLGGKLRRTKED